MNLRKDSRGRVLQKGESQRDNYYIFQYTDIHRKRKVLYAKDLPELRQKKQSVLRDIQDGLDVSQRSTLTLNEAFDRYFAGRTDLKHSSRLNYSYLYDHYVRPGFGRWKLAALTYSDFKAFYLSLVEDYKLSKKTLLLIHSILSPVLTTAVRDNILRTNPAVGIIPELSKKHGWEENRRHALTAEQQRAFLTHAMSKPEFESIAPLLAVLLGTGLRIGEALGLRWEQDVDFSTRTITVSHSLQYRKLESGKTGFYISTPKTSAGRRTVPMISQVEQAFVQARRQQDEIAKTLKKYQKPVVDGYTDFVFTNRCGELYHATAVNRAIRRIIKSYNQEEALMAKKEGRLPMLLPPFSCHHLRHTFCSRLCENETNLKIIQDIMGHASITTTMNRYAEAAENRKAAAMHNLENKIMLF